MSKCWIRIKNAYSGSGSDLKKTFHIAPDPDLQQCMPRCRSIFNPNSLQCCGSGKFFLIPDLTFSHHGSPIQIFSIPDPGSRIRIKELKYFNQKIGFYAQGNMIRDVHPGYGSGLFTHPGSRGQKGPRSRGQKAPYPYPLH